MAGKKTGEAILPSDNLQLARAKSLRQVPRRSSIRVDMRLSETPVVMKLLYQRLINHGHGWLDPGQDNPSFLKYSKVAELKITKEVWSEIELDISHNDLQ